MKPKVSVRIVTYNHERFIGETLESVLCQKVDFPYEMVIAEDCSSDNTRRILLDYQRRHPDVIRLLLNERNMGSRYTTRRARHQCRGEYVAFLDGDDYWTSPDKLQRQAELLDRNPQYAICFHRVRIVHEDGREGGLYPSRPLRPVLTLEECLSENVMPSGSMFYRSNLFTDIPPEFAAVPFGDWPIQICCLVKGDAGFIDEAMGVHRFHRGGLWTQGGSRSARVRIDQTQGRISFLKAADAFLEHRYGDLIARLLARRKDELRALQVERIKDGLRERFPTLYHVLRTAQRGGW